MRGKYMILSCLVIGLCGVSISLEGIVLRARQPEPVRAKQYVPPQLAGSAPANSAVSSGPQIATQGGALPLVVDGAKNPERIPEDLAYRHFISVTAVSTGATRRDISRRDAFVGQLRLSPADRTAYLVAVGDVRDRLTSIEQQGRAAVHGDIAAADFAKRQRDDVLDEAAERIRTSLSFDGAERIRAHVNDHVRKRIRIYGQAK
jgi:hypothetical protein